jgi:metal-responsive CopG/Arc/MetJ family transcriptional regulator
MATMNFSIPEDVKERFNQTFANANKSAVVTRLLEEAIDRAERKQKSDEAVKRILAIRETATPCSTEEIFRIRDEIRAESDAAHG